MEKCYVGHAHINHGSSNVTARYVTLRCGSNRSSHVHCWQNRECSYKRTRCVSALSLSHILISLQSLPDKFQKTLCAFSRTYKILSAMTDNGSISLFLFYFLTLYLRFKLHGNLNLHYMCFPDVPARTPLPCCRKRVDRFHRITHGHIDPSRPSAPPIAPQRPHSPHLQRRRSPLFLSPPFLTSPPRFVSATTRPPTNKPFLPPFQEQAEKASLPVVSLAYLPPHSHPHPSSRSCVRRPFVLISPLNLSQCQLRSPLNNPLPPTNPCPVKPGNKSFVAAGSWCPASPQLATIR